MTVIKASGITGQLLTLIHDARTHEHKKNTVYHIAGDHN